jgi:hypothetical protein
VYEDPHHLDCQPAGIGGHFFFGHVWPLVAGGGGMSKAQRMFEAIMRTKGHMDFVQVKGRYVNAGLQTRWNYFQMGWEMKEATL